MRHSAILVYPIASVPHCGLFNRWKPVDQLMTQPWEKIRELYAESVKNGLPLAAVHRLVDQIEQSHLRSLFAWTSMHDLCIVQTPVACSYNGPFLRVSPLFDGTLEFRYIDTYVKDKQWHRVVNEECGFERLLHFTDQLHWFTRSDAKLAC